MTYDLAEGHNITLKGSMLNEADDDDEEYDEYYDEDGYYEDSIEDYLDDYLLALVQQAASSDPH